MDIPEPSRRAVPDSRLNSAAAEGAIMVDRGGSRVRASREISCDKRIRRSALVPFKAHSVW